MVIGAISTSRDYTLTYAEKVAFRQLTGHEPIDKFGANLLITVGQSFPVDVWEGNNEYIYSVGNVIESIISTNASDNQPIEMLCQLADGTQFIQTPTLNGTTRVALDTPCNAVFRMENEGSTDIAGNVYAYEGTGGIPALNLQRAIISNGNNQTQMAIYRIPKGKVGFLKRGELGIEFTGTPGVGTQFLRGAYKSRRQGGVFKNKKPISLVTVANSVYTDVRSFMDVIPALTDIKISVDAVSDDVSAWASFDMVLIDEDKFDISFLQELKQPGY